MQMDILIRVFLVRQKRNSKSKDAIQNMSVLPNETSSAEDFRSNAAHCHVPNICSGLRWAQTFAVPSFWVKCGVGVTIRETNRVNSK
jgi:hypothetical protein